MIGLNRYFLVRCFLTLFEAKSSFLDLDLLLRGVYSSSLRSSSDDITISSLSLSLFVLVVSDDELLNVLRFCIAFFIRLLCLENVGILSYRKKLSIFFWTLNQIYSENLHFSPHNIGKNWIIPFYLELFLLLVEDHHRFFWSSNRFYSTSIF